MKTIALAISNTWLRLFLRKKCIVRRIVCYKIWYNKMIINIYALNLNKTKWGGCKNEKSSYSY